MKRRHWINDDFAQGLCEIDSFIDSFFPIRTFSTTLRGYDPEKFDLIPKESYYDDKIRRSEEAIEALDRQHESEEKYYQETRKRLVEQKEKIITEKQNKKLDKP